MTNHPNRSRNWVLTETVCGYTSAAISPVNPLSSNFKGRRLIERIVARGSQQEMLALHAKLLIERPLVALPSRRDSGNADRVIRDLMLSGTPADQIVFTRTVEHGDSPAVRAIEAQ